MIAKFHGRSISLWKRGARRDNEPPRDRRSTTTTTTKTTKAVAAAAGGRSRTTTISRRLLDNEPRGSDTFLLRARQETLRERQRERQRDRERDRETEREKQSAKKSFTRPPFLCIASHRIPSQQVGRIFVIATHRKTFNHIMTPPSIAIYPSISPPADLLENLSHPTPPPHPLTPPHYFKDIPATGAKR